MPKSLTTLLVLGGLSTLPEPSHGHGHADALFKRAYSWTMAPTRAPCRSTMHASGGPLRSETTR